MVKTGVELFALADKCSRAEEGQMVPEEAVVRVDDPGKKKPQKRQPAKSTLAVDPESKKPKAIGAAAGGAGGTWCSIHHTAMHDLKDCRKVQSLAGEQQKAWQGAKKVGQGGEHSGCFRYGKPGHFIRDCPSVCGGGCGSGRAGRGGGRGVRGGRNHPPRDCDNHGHKADFGAFTGEDEEEGQYQEAQDVVCIDGGAYALPSHATFKRLSREVNALQPGVEAQRPLKWSDVPITFDSKDHPDCSAGIGALPLIVSPTINNVMVTKILVDRGASLNLLSPKLL